MNVISYKSRKNKKQGHRGRPENLTQNVKKAVHSRCSNIEEEEIAGEDKGSHNAVNIFGDAIMLNEVNEGIEDYFFNEETQRTGIILLMDDDPEDAEEFLSDSNIWFELADAEEGTDEADDDIFGNTRYLDLCEECSPAVIEAFQKSYRSKGNNTNVRFYGTSRSTYFRKKALKKEFLVSSTCSKRIDAFFKPQRSAVDDHEACLDAGVDILEKNADGVIL